MGKKNGVNKYILQGCRQKKKKIEKKINHTIGIHYELFDIYTLHIKEVDMNKNSNVIYQLRNYMSRRR